MGDEDSTRAEELLDRVRQALAIREKESYTDNKGLYVVNDDIACLIRAGAEIRRLNTKQLGGRYVHEVEYKGHIFVSTSDEELTLGVEGKITEA